MSLELDAAESLALLDLDALLGLGIGCLGLLELHIVIDDCFLKFGLVESHKHFAFRHIILSHVIPFIDDLEDLHAVE